MECGRRLPVGRVAVELRPAVLIGAEIARRAAHEASECSGYVLALHLWNAIDGFAVSTVCVVEVDVFVTSTHIGASAAAEAAQPLCCFASASRLSES